MNTALKIAGFAAALAAVFGAAYGAGKAAGPLDDGSGGDGGHGTHAGRQPGTPGTPGTPDMGWPANTGRKRAGRGGPALRGPSRGTSRTSRRRGCTPGVPAPRLPAGERRGWGGAGARRVRGRRARGGGSGGGGISSRPGTGQRSYSCVS